MSVRNTSWPIYKLYSYMGTVADSRIPRLLTPQEVCERLRVSRPTFERTVARGDLRVVRVGRRGVRVRVDELLRYLERQEEAR